MLTIEEKSVILMNLSDDKVVIHSGDRIAQLVFAKVEKVRLEDVTVVNATDRGDKGFEYRNKIKNEDYSTNGSRGAD